MGRSHGRDVVGGGVEDLGGGEVCEHPSHGLAECERGDSDAIGLRRGVVAAADREDVFIAGRDPAQNVQLAPGRLLVKLVWGELVEPPLHCRGVDLFYFDAFVGEVACSMRLIL